MPNAQIHTHTQNTCSRLVMVNEHMSQIKVHHFQYVCITRYAYDFVNAVLYRIVSHMNAIYWNWTRKDGIPLNIERGAEHWPLLYYYHYYYSHTPSNGWYVRWIIMRFYACRYINSYINAHTYSHLNIHNMTDSVCVCVCAHWLFLFVRLLFIFMHASLFHSFFFCLVFPRFVKWIAVNLSYSSWRFAIYIK